MTHFIKKSEIKNNWILIDAKDKLMDMQVNLSTLDGTGEIVQQLKTVWPCVLHQ